VAGRQLALGTGSTRVSSARGGPLASHVITFPRDLTAAADIEQRLDEIARELTGEVVAAGRTVRRVRGRRADRHLLTRTRITTLPAPSQDRCDVAGAAVALLERFELTGRCGARRPGRVPRRGRHASQRSR